VSIHVLLLTKDALVRSWPDLPEDKQPEDDTTLRRLQLHMRVTEIYHVIQSMTRLSEGKDIARTSLKTPDFDWALWRNTIAADNPIMTGHSLGGSAAVVKHIAFQDAAC
jgi:platelet-activating factor acetylhydrolase